MNARIHVAADNHSPSAESLADEKARLFGTLRGLLAESFRLRNEGAAYAKLAHTQGYADGFMRSLIESGLATQQELLQVVQDARRGTDGPATGSVGAEESSAVRIVAA